MKKNNACFGSKLGWERPNWFAPEGIEPQDTFSFQRANWFEYVGNEHKACRERVAIFDQSSFAKFELSGTGAAAALEWICANRVDQKVGKVVYTQLLNSRGGIECDLTVSRIAEDRFYIVTGTGYRTHDYAWIEKNLPSESDVDLRDVTEDWATLSLMGPRSREVLSKVTESNLQAKEFPFATVQEINVAATTIRAIRITYMGELGWELHMPKEEAGNVYDALMQAGEEFDIANAGYRAIESLRLEKGYLAWSSDITPNDSPFEAGLGWAVKLGTQTPFLGREACEKIKSSKLTKKLCCFSVEGADTVLHGRETLYRNGIAVGYVTSAGWGYTVEKNIAYGYVKNDEGVDDDFLQDGTYELEVACDRVAATLELSSLI